MGNLQKRYGDAAGLMYPPLSNVASRFAHPVFAQNQREKSLSKDDDRNKQHHNDSSPHIIEERAIENLAEKRNEVRLENQNEYQSF